MEKNIENNLYLDFYGNLLTDKQREIMTLYYDLDISLSEIATEVGTSRQAVYDAIKVSENTMKSFEQKLGLVEKYLKNRTLLLETIQKIDEMCGDVENKSLLEIKSNISKVLENQ